MTIYYLNVHSYQIKEISFHWGWICLIFIYIILLIFRPQWKKLRQKFIVGCCRAEVFQGHTSLFQHSLNVYCPLFSLFIFSDGGSSTNDVTNTSNTLVTYATFFGRSYSSFMWWGIWNNVTTRQYDVSHFLMLCRFA